MHRRLRDIFHIFSMVMLLGIAMYHADIPGPSLQDRYMASLLEKLSQDSFSPASHSPENFMELTLGVSAVSAAIQNSQRCQPQTSLRTAAALSAPSSSTDSAVCHDHQDRICSISRLSDYYVFGLAHIII